MAVLTLAHDLFVPGMLLLAQRGGKKRAQGIMTSLRAAGL